MIYLIESYGKEGRKYLKIGYTKDISQRMKDYDTHSPEYTYSSCSDSDKIKQYFMFLGPEKIIATGYNVTRLNKAMGVMSFDRGGGR